MKRREIKRIKFDSITDKPSVVETEAEIYEYKGYQFGIFWGHIGLGAYIFAVELSTGLTASYRARCGTKSPKKDLIQEIMRLVDENDFEAKMLFAKNTIEKKRKEYDDKIRELLKERRSFELPINEKI